MRFLVDGMLGKLARWLRMMGHDTMYDVCLEDRELLEIAKFEHRVLLTKDKELYKRAATRGLEAFYVEGKSEAERLAEIADRYGLSLVIDMDKSHCPICNTPIKSTQKEQIETLLKSNTARYYEQFWQCPNCGQIYWQGAHWKQITNILIEANKTLTIRNQLEQP